MDIRGKTFKGVELGLLDDEARELLSILDSYMVYVETGEAGTGSSIEERIRFAHALVEALAGHYREEGFAKLRRDSVFTAREEEVRP